MPVITLTAFRGEQPVITPTLLPEAGAKDAYNVRLNDGALTPIRKSVAYDTVSAANAKTLYKHGDTWLSWSGVVHATPGPVAADRLYYTGDGAPKLLVAATEYALALPPPGTALTAALTGTGAGDVTTRIYVYTWVTGFGEESAPCAASNEVDWKPGNDVTLSGFVTTPPGRNITKQRIYRSQTGTTGTYFYLIAERTATNADFTDDIAPADIQEILPSADWTPPVDTLAGLVAMPNGMMAAFSGRDVYFCEPFHPHAWPEKYSLTVDADIVGLGAVGTSLIVLTKANPQLIQGTHPATMQQVKLETNLPCVNGRSIVDLGFAIAYASHEGLVAISADGTARLGSATLFDRTKWQALKPATMIAAQLSGRYVGFYSTTDADGNAAAGAIHVELGNAPFLLRTAPQGVAAYYDIPTGALYYLAPDDTSIYRLDAPEGVRTDTYWRSKEFLLTYPENFGAILVETKTALTGDEENAIADAIQAAMDANDALIAAGSLGGEINGATINAYPLNGDMLTDLPQLAGSINVGVYADSVKKAQISRTNTPVRLPGGFLASKWEIDVQGSAQVIRIVMGKTIDELKASG